MRMQSTLLAGLAVVLAATSGPRADQPAHGGRRGDGRDELQLDRVHGQRLGVQFRTSLRAWPRWPRFIQRIYDASINYQTPGMRLVQVRSQGEHPPRGGGAQPVAADQRTVAGRQRQIRLAGDGAQPAPNFAAVGIACSSCGPRLKA